MEKIRFQVVLTKAEHARYKKAQLEAGHRSLGAFLRRACNAYSRRILKNGKN